MAVTVTRVVMIMIEQEIMEMIRVARGSLIDYKVSSVTLYSI